MKEQIFPLKETQPKRISGTIIAAGPTTKQRATTPYRHVLIAYNDGSYSVHQQAFNENGDHALFHGVYFGSGKKGFIDAQKEFARMIERHAEFHASIYEDLQRNLSSRNCKWIAKRSDLPASGRYCPADRKLYSYASGKWQSRGELCKAILSVRKEFGNCEALALLAYMSWLGTLPIDGSARSLRKRKWKEENYAQSQNQNP